MRDTAGKDGRTVTVELRSGKKKGAGVRADAYSFSQGHFGQWSMLGNSGKPVTLETMSLTKFSKHVFQEQGIRDPRKPGTCEVSNSRMCRVRES
jgi:hypothetical protein